MPVSIKEYLDSMRAMSTSRSAQKESTDLKTQLLLSQLIEAIAYSKSIKFDKNVLTKQSTQEGLTNKEVLKQMKAQEALVKQLADGQKLSDQQNKKLIDAIDKFYEMAGSQEVNYKKFAANLEKFALKDLPEAVKTRLVNDSRDAHIIGKKQQDESTPMILRLLKNIKYTLQDSFEQSKQFGKKLFVSLDAFRQDLFDAFDNLNKEIEGSGFLGQLADVIKTAGMLWMAFSDQFSQGIFKWGTAFKQIDNIKTMFKAFKEIDKLGNIKGPIKFIKDALSGTKQIFRSFKFLPKFIQKLGFTKGFGAAAKGVGKGISKGLGKGVLKKIPGIGLLMSIWMATERWNRRDYTGALIELASGVASIVPGWGTAISIALDLINLGRDVKIKENTTGTNPIKKSGFRWRWPWQKDDGRGSGEGRGFAGSASGYKEMSATEVGKKLGSAAYFTADSMGKSRSTHYCATGVDNTFQKVFGQRVGGDAWQMGQRLKTGKFGRSHFTYKGKANKMRFGLNELPAGTVLVWNRYPGNPYGHIEIATGTGLLASDFYRSQSTTLGSGYVRNKIYPDIFVPKGSKINVKTSTSDSLTSSSSDKYDSSMSQDEESLPMFEDVLNAFTKFNQDLDASITSSSPVRGKASQVIDLTAPSMSSITAGTPAATTASATVTTAKVASAKPATTQQIQSVQTISSPTNTNVMDTEIKDTDIAMLNSLLFS